MTETDLTLFFRYKKSVNKFEKDVSSQRMNFYH